MVKYRDRFVVDILYLKTILESHAVVEMQHARSANSEQILAELRLKFRWRDPEECRTGSAVFRPSYTSCETHRP